MHDAKELKATPSSKGRTEPFVMQWSYPFLLRDEEAATDMQSHFRGLSSMNVGYYPIAATGQVNGSLHYGPECDKEMKIREGFRSLANGEIVAYRLDAQLQQLEYGKDRWVSYSLGFVLVRHYMDLPKHELPLAPSGKAQLHSEIPLNPPGNANGEADEGCAIFSLYSYNRPLAAYETDADGFRLSSLPFWQGQRRYRVGTRACDEQSKVKAAAHSASAVVGIRVRVRGKSNAEIVGILPRRSILTVQGDATKGWGQIAEVVSGTAVSPAVGGPAPAMIEGQWVFLKDLDSEITPVTDAVIVLNSPHPVKAGELLGYLGENPGSDVAGRKGAARQSRTRVAIEVFAGDDFPAYLSKSRLRAETLPEAAKTILVVDANTVLCEKPRLADHTLDKTHVLVPNDDSPRTGPFEHGRVFRSVTDPSLAPPPEGSYRSSENLKLRVSSSKFKRLSREKRAAYPLLLMPVEELGDCWGLRGTEKTGEPLSLWSRLPISHEDARAEVMSRTSFSHTDLYLLPPSRRFVESNGTRWWKILFGDHADSSLLGWVSDNGYPGTHWVSPYAWPGFEVADGTMFTPLAALQRSVCLNGTVDPTHKAEFCSVAKKLGESDIIKKLELAIDPSKKLVGNATSTAIAHARRTPWLAHALSRLIARFESQWSSVTENWSQLTPFATADWQADMERQTKRGWWSEVAGKVLHFPPTADVHHLHPLGWVDNFIVRDIHDLAWGTRVTPAFKMRVIEISRDLGIDPNWLMSCMAFETGYTFSPSKKNGAGSSGIGLIQIMRKSAIELDTTTELLAAMTAVEQLSYVYAFLLPRKARYTSLEELYLSILWPPGMGKGNDDVIFAAVPSAPTEINNVRYVANTGLDKNKDKIITREEVVVTIQKIHKEGMSEANFG